MADTRYLTPAKAARGLGAARAGTQHHMRQRVSAIALFFLVPWFVYSMLRAGQAGLEDARGWVAEPLNAILLLLTAGAAFYHMRLGMQVIIEDYIGKSGTRGALLILNSFVVIVLFAVVAMSVLKIWIDTSAR